VGKGGSIIFTKDGKLTMKDPGKPDKVGSYRLDADKSPKQLDLIVSKDGAAVQGIYELDDDQLKIGFSMDEPKGKRPAQFKGEKVVVMLLKRQKS
jgi:uncharacterized protein (TIGR03067 family)